MHQSKKQLFARQWNQQFGMDFNDKIESDDLTMNELPSREAGTALGQNPLLKK